MSGREVITTIISPHLDDAILSYGQTMTTDKFEIVTVFAGVPEAEPHYCSEYDHARGFTTSYEAMMARRHEDIEACAAIGARFVHLGFFDHQYGRPPDESLLTDILRDYIHELTYIPLGIGHPDHELVARCARAAAPKPTTLFAYEEMPHRVDYPEHVPPALDRIRADGWSIAQYPYKHEIGDLDRKVKAIAAYRSQFPDGADNPALLVSERSWRIAQ